MGNANLTGCFRMKRRKSTDDINKKEFPVILPVSGSTTGKESAQVTTIPENTSTVPRSMTGSLQRNVSLKVRTLSRSTSYRRNAATDSGFELIDAYEQNPDPSFRGTAILFELKNLDPDFRRKYGLSPIPNASKDASDLYDVLRSAGYKVERKINSTVKDARNTVKAIAEDESNSDSFICVLITHLLPSNDGTKKYLAFFDEYISCRKLFNPLRKSRQLSGIPKIIFINSCSNIQKMLSIEFAPTINVCASPFPGIDYAPLDPDFLVLYADCSTMCSIQYPELGSYFVQKLCSLLRYNSRHQQLVLVDLLTKLNGNLRTTARLSSSATEADTNVETSAYDMEPLIIISTLRKDFHLFPRMLTKTVPISLET